MTATPIASAGSIFLDPRGGGRALRMTWHAEADVIVLSLWREKLCTGSFRLPIEQVPELIDALRGGLDIAYDAARSTSA